MKFPGRRIVDLVKMVRESKEKLWDQRFVYGQVCVKATEN